jgi:hypothetical protein
MDSGLFFLGAMGAFVAGFALGRMAERGKARLRRKEYADLMLETVVGLIEDGKIPWEEIGVDSRVYATWADETSERREAISNAYRRQRKAEVATDMAAGLDRYLGG